MIIITIPAYNEETTIGQTIEEIKKVMRNTSYKYKLQVVNDGSIDKTAEVAKKYGAEVISHKRNLGLTQTFLTEIKNCLKKNGDIIVHIDADGQYNASAIPEMVKKIEEGYDLVLGSRFYKDITYKNELSRLIGNIIFAKVISGMIKQKITDSTTGYRAFTKEVAKEIDYINTFTYTQEQIIKAARHGFKITEVPITARQTNRKSRLFKSPFDYATKAWINIFRIYRDFDPLKFFGKIGIFLLLCGAIIGSWLVYLVIKTGEIGHLPASILSILLIISGIQTILFGLLADMKKQ